MFIIGVTQLCYVLFENESMDDIISVFHSHKLLTDDDEEILQHFAHSKHFQKQYLLWYLRNLGLPVWLTICNLLLKEKSLETTGNQLVNGEL